MPSLDDEDDITDSESEGEDELEIREKMLALEKKKEELEKQRGAAAEEAEEIEKKNKQKEYIRTWGPILILTPLCPALLAMITIAWGGVVLSAFEVPTGPCEDMAGFLPFAIAFCYIFLFFYSWIFVRPKPFKSFKPIIIGYGVIFFFCFIVYAILTLFWVSAMPYSFECPEINLFATFTVVAFWATCIVLALYGFLLCGKRKAAKGRVKEQERMASMEKRIKAEEDAKKSKDAKRSAKDSAKKETEDAAQAEAERQAFYDTEDDESGDERVAEKEDRAKKVAIA